MSVFRPSKTFLYCAVLCCPFVSRCARGGYQHVDWWQQIWTLLRLCNSLLCAQLQVAEAVRAVPRLASETTLTS